ncbi:hypothetical protein DE146DRAFT_761523 [Phaeosphaeria sp. MPI-PUGE-AT-0046c]|nr:hypothetical protein DE146DRAFT_761523 [Phaeosphaeria sp. MPI-PUGE-AT-0046c]
MVAKGPPKLVPSAHSLAIARLNQEQSPLLGLPAELRTRIYEVVTDTDIDKASQ